MLKAMSTLTLIRQGFVEHPAMDVAVSRAVLDAVAAQRLGPVFRLHVPGRILAFGRADRVQAGYAHAVNAARAHRFAPVERLAGGRAAVFHEATLAFSLAEPDEAPRERIKERFDFVSGIIANAFRNLGLDARVGEIPGEYCPGEWSINLDGRSKVMGVGQRLVRGAAHVGGVVVVDDAASIRDVLIPVYRSLRLDWDPRTTGALADRSPGMHTGIVAQSIIEELSRHRDVRRGELPLEVVHAAKSAREQHLPQVA